MCLMIMEVIRFNTWDAFNRALLKLNNYPNKQIHGQIYLPAHFTFKTWDEFHEAVKEIKNIGERVSNAVRLTVLAGLAGYPDSNNNHALPSIYGEIYVEITDPWIRRC